MTYGKLIEHRHAGCAPEGTDTICKRAAIMTPVVDFENRLIKGVVSCESVDVDGDVVIQSGIDTSYFAGPDESDLGVRTVYMDHDYSRPVGKNVRLSVKNGQMFATTYITKLPVGDDVLTLVDEGIIRGLSIGFRVLEARPATTEDQFTYGVNCQRVIPKSLMLEYSLTPMPCNPDAMLEMASMVSAKKIKPQTLNWVKSMLAQSNTIPPNPEQKEVIYLLDDGIALP